MEPEEFLAMVGGAKQFKNAFDAWTEAGFSEDQALKLVVYFMILNERFGRSLEPGGFLRSESDSNDEDEDPGGRFGV